MAQTNTVPTPVPPPPQQSAVGDAPTSPNLVNTPAEQQQQPPAPQEPEIPDPGPWEQLGREANEILFYQNGIAEGLRLSYNRSAGQNIQVGHKIVLGAPKESGYTFAPTYVGTHQNEGSPQGFPVVLGSVDTEGNMVSQIIHEPIKGLTTKFSGQTQAKDWMGAQVEMAYAGKGFTTGLTLANCNPVKRNGIVVANYLQKLGSYFSAGLEMVYQSADGHEQPSLSAAMRYRTDNDTFLAKICPSQQTANASYFHKMDAKTLFATDLTLNAGQQTAQASFGWQANYRSAIFKGLFNTNGVVAASLEQDIIPQMMGISYNASLDHHSGEAKFGLGFTINS